MAGKKKKGFLKILIISFVLALCVTLALEPFMKFLYPLKYRDDIEECASVYYLDKYLVMGIISAESGFDSDAQSHKDAHGLMQLKDETALWCVENFELDIPKEDIHKPENNIRIGCAYMRYLLDIYGGNVDTAVAAYNAGLGNVNKWLADKRYSDGKTTLRTIPFEETRVYVQKVQKRKELYNKLYKDAK